MAFENAIIWPYSRQNIAFFDENQEYLTHIIILNNTHNVPIMCKQRLEN